ncbi:hypothetical protein [Fimbriiglobus ruber]|uniref:NfeD-like C-terminal domain-containing protein n=1 Tax=Fimbriiglobus ruber TaxID=1908690 RepID=A0A225D925_9BACT|nr:hypothetical protein [Fimbriiglobus ruber]OWK38061.1 protein of unknown function DUF107 [Fimbriiglobus ruber]
MDSYLLLAIILIGFGAVLIVSEFFLPTGGVLVVAAVACFAVAVGVTLLYGDTLEAAAVTITVSVGLPIAGVLLFNAYKRLSLTPGPDSDSGGATVASTPEMAVLAQLKGQFGKTVTPMRPSGSVEIDGRRIDAMTEGMMLAAGVAVKCVDVRAGRVIVRQIDPPEKLAALDLDMDDLK